ncbi:MAG: hypothetical protein LBJ75_04325, partial [Puniceicoccales bacterium]|nr:hypothetical protein [Puniceicoccales bacterium]
MCAHRKSHFVDAILLIAGTAIGAGVLGLPVALRSAGYVPALVGVASVYLLTLLSGILLAQLFIENHDKDLPTLFFRHLGKFGATLFNISYFTLAFCLLVAYWSCLCEIFGHMVPVVIAAGFLIYYGLRHRFSCLEKLNSILTTGLIISFAFFIFTIFRSHGQKFPLFEQGRWFQLP